MPACDSSLCYTDGRLCKLISQAAGSMSRKDLLKQYGLIKNPYTDRTAEKTTLDELSAYMHSDLQGFQPSGAACSDACNRLFSARSYVFQLTYMACCRDNGDLLFFY